MTITTPTDRLLAYKGDYLGLAEIAAILGINQQSASNRLSRGTLMQPDVRLAMGPIWTITQAFQIVQAEKRRPRATKQVAGVSP